MKQKSSGANFVFAVDNDADVPANQWILDSGSSRHLVSDSSLLTNPTACQSECLTASTDGSVLRITQQRTIDI